MAERVRETQKEKQRRRETERPRETEIMTERKRETERHIKKNRGERERNDSLNRIQLTNHAIILNVQLVGVSHSLHQTASAVF